ncbi:MULTISPECIES: glycosyl hydrolase family 95 catalytic domain-containing protein [Barnesiella]|uniref:glycosyl hydrolase family 95 catalytic domain-containing protein n=1 Tax=Barnesiella TaxID=397864 RepID=UPI001D7DCD49|nr:MULTISPECIES: glycoside hydrolase N-terminal domain-containing protein [Barnesiella]MDB0678366.1 glycoside hydrolase N-terminal domain-containing protein [Barnesiella intestinihominis]MDB0683738.1 glycoside hydrolase N-terminal domain-containing protein [Barnesiella intestinihominis]HJF97506.1 glycoside hydrolase N-terminal domain-containing protein [Barnesiella intestinihominis]
MKKVFWIILCMFFILPVIFAENMKLHYERPAEYFEEALVIGNGTMGATLYGGVKKDKISFNDITLWTGEPESENSSPDAFNAIPEIRALLDNEDYQGADKAQYKVQGHYSENYQPLGTLTIEYLDDTVGISDYHRWLDIGNATARTQYLKGGKLFTSDYFASAPDSVIVIRLKSENKEGIHALLSFDSPLPHSSQVADNEISVEGYAAYHSFPVYYKAEDKHRYDPERGIHFKTLVRVLSVDGRVKNRYSDSRIEIDGSTEVLIWVANVTSFNGFDKDPVKEGRNYRSHVEKRMKCAIGKTYDALREAHIRDYKYYFDRVKLDLGDTDDDIAALPTDKQLLFYTDCKQRNPDLEELYFQFGRYLLISSSRTPGVPANLQGLWNESVLPPWSSNYTVNINLEENYWASGTANLIEMQYPLIEFIANLSKTGRKTAKDYYGVERGWCLGHNSDIWAMTCPVGLNEGDPSWACWTMGGTWLSTHIWEHYLFTLDKEFLCEFYPVLKGAAEFCMDWLVEKDGKLVTSPGTSPENKYITPDGYVGATSYGNTSDLAMIRECLIDAAEASKVLGVDKSFRKRIKKTLSRLYPYQIGKDGNLQEWYYDWQDQDPYHRHQSHLFGLYPGHHLSVEETPELAAACARTLQIKGDETTGWSTGWRVNLLARLRDGEKAYHMYRRLLRYVSPDNYKGEDARRGGGTYPNLLDAHSPFQIDGNFGGCSGVIEMLMQSSTNKIVLLPALPESWADGKVQGICARGGFVVDMEWKNREVASLIVSSLKGGQTEICFNGVSKKVVFKAGEEKRLL